MIQGDKATVKVFNATTGIIQTSKDAIVNFTFEETAAAFDELLETTNKLAAEPWHNASIEFAVHTKYPCKCGSSLCESSPLFPVNKLIQAAPELMSSEPIHCPSETSRTVVTAVDGRQIPTETNKPCRRCHIMEPSYESPFQQYPITQCIVHLNDYHRWTREQIADWLDTLPVNLEIHPYKLGNDNEHEDI